MGVHFCVSLQRVNFCKTLFVFCGFYGVYIIVLLLLSCIYYRLDEVSSPTHGTVRHNLEALD